MALQKASGCELVVDYRDPFYCVWVLDGDHNELAVKRGRDLERMIDWMTAELLRVRTMSTRVHNPSTLH